MSISLRKGIYWVGAIDWEVRNVHGYITPRGTTYNAYLVVDEKITVIDTVKKSHAAEMMRRIKAIVDPKDIDYIVSLHAELDHAGAIPELLEEAPNATIICSKEDINHLELHFHREFPHQIMKTGEIISLGARSLSFVTIPMVHWPDSMVAYMPEEKILFSNDAFGQHLASSERFDDEYPNDIIYEELQTYYANIVMPYAMPVRKALDAVSGLDIEMIANAHGIIWRKKANIEKVAELYAQWANHENDGSAIIVFDSMWGSTKEMAYVISEVLEDLKIPYHLYNLHAHTDDISAIIPKMMVCKYMFVGSSNLNNTIIPTIAGFLTYAKGFKPRNKTAMAFSSYGWSNSAFKEIESYLSTMGCRMLTNYNIKYVPSEQQKKDFKAHVIEQIIEKK
ncbi:MAG: FprA family A-type flavoprotein [Culicoidibacterales bacterium]